MQCRNSKYNHQPAKELVHFSDDVKTDGSSRKGRVLRPKLSAHICILIFLKFQNSMDDASLYSETMT